MSETLTAPAAARVHRVAVVASSAGYRNAECPNGASSFSPGLARQRRDYPGLNEPNSPNPEGVVSVRAQSNTATTPTGLLNSFAPWTQGRPQSRPTSGWRTESHWDSWAAPRFAAPVGQNVNSRGCKPTVAGSLTTRPRRGCTIHRPTNCATLSGSHDSFPTRSVGLHPRLFTSNPFGIRKCARFALRFTHLTI